MEHLLDDYQEIVATIPEPDIETQPATAPQLHSIAPHSRISEILVIEDNEGDVRLIREAFRETDSPHHITVANDGEEALSVLHGIGLLGSAARPDLILLDLNLPRKDGRQVLTELKQEVILKRIPVIVLSSSNAPRDIRACYDHRANCYIRKPLSFDEFIATVKSIERFWLSEVMLPAA
ncbi:MAG TPA: response regulator [Tepidisphaeraceae bacterium]|jgi:CheY-like chemotaxis protein|nr:response regulator [Tepidisphaeraceae bacterium]